MQKIFAKSVELQAQRMKKGFSRKELSHKVGLSAHTIGQIEKGAQATTPLTAKRICQAIGNEDFDQLFKIVSS